MRERYEPEMTVSFCSTTKTRRLHPAGSCSHNATVETLSYSSIAPTPRQRAIFARAACCNCSTSTKKLKPQSSVFALPFFVIVFETNVLDPAPSLPGSHAFPVFPPFTWFSRHYLEVWTGDTFGELPEERHHDLGELGGLDHVEDLLQLVQEHHLQRKHKARHVSLCQARVTLRAFLSFFFGGGGRVVALGASNTRCVPEALGTSHAASV